MGDEQRTLFGNPSEQSEDKKLNKPAHGVTLMIYVDGASRGNPGPSGAGIYIYNATTNTVFIKEAFFLGIKTNNQAEYLALALAVGIIRNKIDKNEIAVAALSIVSDSELLIKQMQGFYRIKNQQLLEIKRIIDDLIGSIPRTFEHVLRERNTIADQLANQGIEKKKRVPDEVRKLLQQMTISLP